MIEPSFSGDYTRLKTELHFHMFVPNDMIHRERLNLFFWVCITLKSNRPLNNALARDGGCIKMTVVLDGSEDVALNDV